MNIPCISTPDVPTPGSLPIHPGLCETSSDQALAPPASYECYPACNMPGNTGDHLPLSPHALEAFQRRQQQFWAYIPAGLQVLEYARRNCHIHQQ